MRNVAGGLMEPVVLGSEALDHLDTNILVPTIVCALRMLSNLGFPWCLTLMRELNGCALVPPGGHAPSNGGHERPVGAASR